MSPQNTSRASDLAGRENRLLYCGVGDGCECLVEILLHQGLHVLFSLSETEISLHRHVLERFEPGRGILSRVSDAPMDSEPILVLQLIRSRHVFGAPLRQQNLTDEPGSMPVLSVIKHKGSALSFMDCVFHAR